MAVLSAPALSAWLVGGHSLSGRAKRDRLVAWFGEGGFDYVGYSLRIYAGSPAVAVAVSSRLRACSTALFFGLAPYPVVAAPGAQHLAAWLLGALLPFWTGHMWLMVHRGCIRDDLVAFALRDPISRVIGMAVAALLRVQR